MAHRLQLDQVMAGSPSARSLVLALVVVLCASVPAGLQLACSNQADAIPDGDLDVDIPDGARASDGAADGGADARTGDAGRNDAGGPICDQGQKQCGASGCRDLQNDRDHCGECGNACGPGAICCAGKCEANVTGTAPPLATLGACGQLRYGLYANRDQRNAVNVLPDFSHAGYRGGGVAIPDVPVVHTVSPGDGDDRARLQAAIDEVAARPVGPHGFRGAVLLKAGKYEVGDTLYIRASGVVLRGEGQGAGGSVLVATAAKQYALLEVTGTGSGLGEVSGTRTRITTKFVAVGSRTFDVQSASKFAVGDAVVVVRTPNQSWIDALGMGQWGWTTSSYTIGHERRITAISGNTLTVDIPLVDTIEDQYGGGAVTKAQVTGRINQCGVEDLRLESVFKSETDENHAWTGIRLSRVTDSWVRRVTTRYFGNNAVVIEGQASFNTVEEVACLDPKSEITGGRRYPFAVNGGVGNLFQRCFARHGRHNFVTGARVTGPHAWLDSLAVENHADDGPHHRWATGLLFDNIQAGSLKVQNREDSGSGHGWAGAQTLFWNAVASEIIADAPTGAMNYAVGCVGKRAEGNWAPDEPFGLWESHGTSVMPRSLYLQQLKDRLGPAAVENVTVPAQRTGRIWTALERWAGEGRLADYL